METKPSSRFVDEFFGSRRIATQRLYPQCRPRCMKSKPPHQCTTKLVLLDYSTRPESMPFRLMQQRRLRVDTHRMASRCRQDPCLKCPIREFRCWSQLVQQPEGLFSDQPRALGQQLLLLLCAALR